MWLDEQRVSVLVWRRGERLVKEWRIVEKYPYAFFVQCKIFGFWFNAEREYYSNLDKAREAANYLKVMSEWKPKIHTGTAPSQSTHSSAQVIDY